MLNVSATQQLAKEVQALKSENQQLKAQNEQFQTQLKKIELLEARLNQFLNQ